jgi:hypothetical protein
MNTNTFSETASPGAGSSEPRGVIGLLLAAIILALRKYVQRMWPGRPEWISRDEFFAAMLDLNERIHADHLALLEKLDANHRELLAALERQATHINALEAGLARVDERTRK